MKIIKLQSENFKKIRAIEITPHENTIIISGANGQGKTSVLDSIFVGLAGKQKDCIKPIREGEASSTITIELDSYFVTRTFKQGGSKLEVVSKEGEIMSSPQALLNSLMGSLTFDPLEFSKLKEKEQRELLLKLIKVDLSGFEEQRKELYSYRHDVGVTRDAMESVTVPEFAEAEGIIKKGKIDTLKILHDITAAERERGVKREAASERSNVTQKRVLLTQQIEALQVEYKKLVERDKILESMLLQEFQYDLEALKTQLSEAETVSASVDQAQVKIKAFNQRKELQDRYNTYTSRIEAIDRDRELALNAAQMPIAGLSVSDDGVLYNNIPFSQLSSAEKLKVSMAIAMAMNPELRVIRILDGSLLDDVNMAVIREMAKDGDYQVWIERVDSSGKVGFFIEEGEVVAVNE